MFHPSVYFFQDLLILGLIIYDLLFLGFHDCEVFFYFRVSLSGILESPSLRVSIFYGLLFLDSRVS